MFEVRLPKMGMSTVEVDVLTWHVRPGDRVEKGTPLADVQSEKVDVVIESEVEGIMAEIVVLAGEVATAGAVLCRIQETGTSHG